MPAAASKRKTSKKLTRQQKVDLSWIDKLHPDKDWERMDPRIKKLQVKRDYRYFDRYILDKAGDDVTKLYQLKAAAPMIFVIRHQLQKHIEAWMRKEEAYSEEEIQAWSMPRFEWPEEFATPEQLVIVEEWRKKYQIKDRTDWSKGILLSDKEKRKLDEYKQIAILQPRQTGKSEIVVRVDAYAITIIHEFDAGVFAPTEKQAKNFIFQRTRDYIEENPFYKGRFERINSLDLTFEKAPTASGSSLVAASASPGANIEGDSLDWAMLDESQDITDFKVNKSIKYMLAAKNGVMIKLGTVNTIKGHFYDSTTKKGAAFWHQVIIHPDICAATNDWWRGFISKVIQEDGRWSDTVRMSVFLEWMLALGMFCTEEQWDSFLDPTMDFVPMKKTGLQFATIDVAQIRDETVCHVWEADQTVEINGRHPIRWLNAMAMQGVDYDSQFDEIKAWLDINFNAAAIGVDDTGGRGGLADRFKHTSYRVEAFVYTRPGKSEWYTNLQTMIQHHYTAYKTGIYHERLIYIPGSEEAQKEKIFRDMGEQMLSLQREYKKKMLVVHHPDIEGAKDDHPDCFMMAAWMASRIMVSIDELMNEVENISETEMDKMDWNKDQNGEAGRKRAASERDKRRKAAQDDEELQEILRESTDLDGGDLW